MARKTDSGCRRCGGPWGCGCSATKIAATVRKGRAGGGPKRETPACRNCGGSGERCCAQTTPRTCFGCRNGPGGTYRDGVWWHAACQVFDPRVHERVETVRLAPTGPYRLPNGTVVYGREVQERALQERKTDAYTADDKRRGR